MILEIKDGSYWILEGSDAKREVCTVQQCCKKLSRTRRQVYRYIESGILETRAKLLGEWLIDSESVQRLLAEPPDIQPLPGSLQWLFPEYFVKDLNVGRDRILILSRVLEKGGVAELKWVFKRYKKTSIINFIQSDGSRLLSKKSLNLWRIFFKIPTKDILTRPVSHVWADRNSS